VLADLNAHALRKTARRIRRYRPTAYQLDVLSPFQLPEPRFDSISLSYVLHCLPGSVPEKAVAVDHNAADRADDLEACLRRRLGSVELRVEGAVALFRGRLG
jgi:hypothetical protein